MQSTHMPSGLLNEKLCGRQLGEADAAVRAGARLAVGARACLALDRDNIELALALAQRGLDASR